MSKHFLGILSCMAISAAAQSSASERVVTAPALTIEETRLRASGAETSTVPLSSELVVVNPVASTATQAANFHVAESGARSFTNTVALRGLSNTPIFGDASVSAYLDHMPLGNAFAFPTELAGLQSAELVRGLGHTTQFGQSGTAGALVFRTPTGAADTRVAASFGNHSARSVSAQTGATLSDANVFAAVGYSARDGFITNTRLRRDIDWRESTSGLARVHFKGGETANYSILLAGQRVRDGVQALVPLGGPLFEVDRSAEGTTPLRSFGISGQAEFAVPTGRLSATTSYTDWKLTGATNVLNLGFAELANESTFGQKAWSEEIRFSSVATSNFQWSVGAFGLLGEMDGAFARSIFNNPFERSNFEIERRTLAGFGEVTWKLSSEWELIGGLRAEANWKDLHRVEEVPVPRTFERSAYSSALLPRIGLLRRFGPDAEATVSLGSSYKPGGFSAFTGNRALTRFGPERNHGADASYTRRSADRKWSATLRGYAYRVEGYQIERSFQTGGFVDDYLVVNAERARSLGGELELLWRPFAGLTVTASGGVSHVTLRRFSDPYTGTRYDGNRAPYAPTHDLNVSVEYRHASGFAAGASAFQAGRTHFTESEAEMFTQESYTLLNARIGYVAAKFELWAYIENLTEREYYSSMLPGTFHGTPGAPRTYGIAGSVKF
jgi:iron complex outermembrane recepter protein